MRDCDDVKYSNEMYDAKALDQCNCMPNYIWNRTDLKCYVNCGVIPHTNGKNGNYACYCKTGYTWYSSPPENKCVKKRLLLATQESDEQ